MIKRLIRTIGGADGPAVHTELTLAQAQPGRSFEGIVEVTGGGHRVEVGYLDLVLCALVNGS
jgi:sporulation-control protein spo0M